MTATANFIAIGFPIIALATFIIGLIVVYLNTKALPNTNQKFVHTVIYYWLLLSSVFLIWSAGVHRTLAIHFYMIGIIGFYLSKVENKMLQTIHNYFLMFTLVCSLGLLNLFGYNFFMSSLSVSRCLQYFPDITDAVIHICDVDGFLTVVNIFSIFSIFSMSYIVVSTVIDSDSK